MRSMLARMLSAFVVLSLTAAPIDTVTLAITKKWAELERAIDGKKLKGVEASSLTTTRIVACEAGQYGIADKLAKLGAAGNLSCLATRGDWAALEKELTVGPWSHSRADAERLPRVLALVAAAKQDALYVSIARVDPDSCPGAIAQALDVGGVKLAKQVNDVCHVAPDTLVGWLSLACIWRSADVVRAWRDFGVDVTARLDRGTCLHQAVLRGDEEITRLLLDAGADPNAVTQESPAYRSPSLPDTFNSVAGYAVIGGNPEVVKLLLAKGADFSKVKSATADAALFPGAAFPPPQNVKVSAAVEKSDPTRVRRLAQALQTEQRAVLVVGGGTTPEAAQASLASFDAVKPLITRFFVLPAGFPRIVKSDDVPGLKPGFHVVLLAAAPEWELQTFFPIVNAVRPGSAVRQVTWTPDSGPAPLALTDAFDRHTSLSRKVKKSTLSMTALWRGGEAQIAATLIDATGALVTTAEGTADFGRCDGACAGLRFEPEGSGFAASAQGEFPACTSPDVKETTARVVLSGDTLDVKVRQKLLSKGQCD